MRSSALFSLATAIFRTAPDPAELAQPLDGRADILSVMNVNTFLLEVRFIGHLRKAPNPASGFAFGSKPDMEERAKGLAEWFNTLSEQDRPDVVVFNEIFSKAGARLMKALCSDSFRRKGGKEDGEENIIKCDEDRYFGFVTRNANPASLLKLSGGVVIAVRKGMSIVPGSVHDEMFCPHYSRDLETCTCAGDDCMSRKGYIAARVTHPSASVGEVVVVGTHTQAWQNNTDVRKVQWRKIRAYIDTLPEDTKVICSGDHNAEESEVDDMHRILHSANSELSQAGFWLPHLSPVKYSTYGGGAHNALLHYDEHEAHAKSPHDQVMYIRDRGVAPARMQWQYVPLKSEQCFRSELGVEIDDLSDHNAAYAEFCYGERCAERELVGHRGFTSATGQFRCCPGRGRLLPEGAPEGSTAGCFDWAPGGSEAAKVTASSTEGGKSGVCKKGPDWLGKWCSLGDENEHSIQAATTEECYAKLFEMDLPLAFLECARK